MEPKLIIWVLAIARVAETEGISIKEETETEKDGSLKIDRVEQQKAYDLEEAIQEIKMLKDENKYAQREINLLKDENNNARLQLLKAKNRNDKRRVIRDDKIHGIERMIRNADEADDERIEEMLKGKMDSISGRKIEATMRRAKDDAFQLLEKKIKKLEKSLTATIDSQVKTLTATIDSQVKSLTANMDSKEQSLMEKMNSKEQSLTEKIDSQGTKIDSQGTKIDSAIANQLRCLSGFQELYGEWGPDSNAFNLDGVITYQGRVSFNLAFSGAPDLCFGAYAYYRLGTNVELISKDVKSTHFDFKFMRNGNPNVFKGQGKVHRLGVQWIACGHSNRGMTAEMLLDLKFNH